MGGLGRLRASSRAVLGDSESAESRRRTEEGPSERMAVSLRMTVGRTLHQVSTRLPMSGSVCMAVSARPQPGPWPPGSSGPRQTSMRSEGSEPELHRALEAQEETLEPLSEAGDSCCSTPLLTAREREQGRSGARLLPSLGAWAMLTHYPWALGWVRDASCSDCHLHQGTLGSHFFPHPRGLEA